MKREDVFEKLEPPTGGLTRLRAAMVERPGSRWLLWTTASGLAALALVVLGLVLWPRPEVGNMFVAALPEHRQGEPVAVAANDQSTALLRVPTENPKVVFYWVASTDGSH